MRKYIVIAFIVFSTVYLQSASSIHSADRVDHDCSKCHKLTNDEAANILREVFPNVTVIEIRAEPVKGLWEIAFEAQSRKNIGYLDFSKEKIAIGNIVNLKTRRNLTGERLYELTKVDISQIPLGDALLMGDKDAKYKVIVFDDPD